MLWKCDNRYQPEPFEKEADLESAIQEVKEDLFGRNRIYLETKKKIGAKGKTNNIPDAYLLDLSSSKEPKLYVVENELAKHHALKHIAVQILEFSLSFETSPQKVKKIIKEKLQQFPDCLKQCTTYAQQNGFDNIDYLLERMIFEKDSFSALVIIDEISDELEKVLISRFKFPVEILSLQRYASSKGERVYQFDPFLNDVTDAGLMTSNAPLDPAEIDTIVVPAQEDGFEETFLGEDRWYAIRIHSSMIPKIKHIAAYQVAPTSAITYIADVSNIEQWKDTGKYVVKFENAARKIGPIKLVSKSIVRAPQAPRYTSIGRLLSAKNLDEAF